MGRARGSWQLRPERGKVICLKGEDLTRAGKMGVLLGEEGGCHLETTEAKQLPMKRKKGGGRREEWGKKSNQNGRGHPRWDEPVFLSSGEKGEEEYLLRGRTRKVYDQRDRNGERFTAEKNPA